MVQARTTFVALLVVLAWAGAAAPVAGHDGRKPGRDRPRVDAQAYLTPQEALRLGLGEGRTVQRCRLRLTDAEHKAISERIGRRLFETEFEVFRAVDGDGQATAYAVITEEIGKFQPITFMVAVTPTATVKEVAVMVYRESHGGEVRRRRFLRQYIGKTTRDRIRVNRDIINVSGATLSAGSLSRGTRKVLHAVDQLVIGSTRRPDLRWTAVDLDTREKHGGGEARGGSKVDDDAADESKPDEPKPDEPKADEPKADEPKTDDDTTDGENSARESGSLRQIRYRMGSTLEIVAWGEPDRVRAALQAAFVEVARLEALLSTYLPDSEICAVNAALTGQWTPLSADTVRCLGAALEMAQRSDGAFDPTLRAGGHSAVELDEPGARVRLMRHGLRLDLGGIAKGYALDRAAQVLRARGVQRGMLNFGGQILALAPPVGERCWIVGVRDPRDADRVLGYYALEAGSVSTSAGYERGAHIVDPRTGSATSPSQVALSATVCHPSATTADALSTALAARGAPVLSVLAESLTARGAMLLVEPGSALPRRHRGGDAPRFVTVANGAVANSAVEDSAVEDSAVEDSAEGTQP